MSIDNFPLENNRFQPEADFVLDGQAHLRNGASRVRPQAFVYQRRDVILILEARHFVVRLLLKIRARNTP